MFHVFIETCHTLIEVFSFENISQIHWTMSHLKIFHKSVETWAISKYFTELFNNFSVIIIRDANYYWNFNNDKNLKEQKLINHSSRTRILICVKPCILLVVNLIYFTPKYKIFRILVFIRVTELFQIDNIEIFIIKFLFDLLHLS